MMGRFTGGTPEGSGKVIAMEPIGRMGKPEEIAALSSGCVRMRLPSSPDTRWRLMADLWCPNDANSSSNSSRNGRIPALPLVFAYLTDATRSNIAGMSLRLRDLGDCKATQPTRNLKGEQLASWYSRFGIDRW